MSENPAEPGTGPTINPGPAPGPDPINPDIPTDPDKAGDEDEEQGNTPAGAADTASLGSPDESPTS